LGTARRKGRQQITRTYRHRATSRLYKVANLRGLAASGPTAALKSDGAYLQLAL